MQQRIVILNIHNGVVGLPNYQGFMPGETAELSVNDAEFELWNNCKYVKILDAAIEPGSDNVSALSDATGNPRSLLENNEMGATPQRRRVGRPRNIEPGNPGEPGPENALSGLAGVYQQSSQRTIPGTAANIIDDSAETWPEPVGQGGQCNGGGASGDWQEPGLLDTETE
jgi:hypothetical protein